MTTASLPDPIPLRCADPGIHDIEIASTGARVHVAARFDGTRASATCSPETARQLAALLTIASDYADLGTVRR
jgi:hypothetical protein